MRRTRGIAVLLAVTCCLPLSACSSDTDPVSPQDSASDPLPSSTPADPQSTEASWRDKYSDGELRAYDAALVRWEEYEERSAPLWADGRVSRQAKPLFREYLASPAWQIALDQLRTYESVEVQVPHPPAVLWSRAGRISLQGDSASVTLRQCVDLTTQGTTQYGDPVAWPKPFRKPVLREVVLDKRTGAPWLVTNNEPPSVADVTRCSEGDDPS